MPGSGVPPEFAGAGQIADGQHLPLRYVASERGAERGRLEVSSIQKKPLPLDQFQVPPGYAVLSLEQLLGAMMGGLRTPPGIQLPPGSQLPPGFKLPSGVTLPPSVKLPK